MCGRTSGVDDGTTSPLLGGGVASRCKCPETVTKTFQDIGVRLMLGLVGSGALGFGIRACIDNRCTGENITYIVLGAIAVLATCVISGWLYCRDIRSL